jgi:hypothetical protein
METISYKKIIRYLEKHHKTLDDTFKLIIIDLLNETNFDYYIFKKILKGAYVILKDNGYFYKKWILYHKNNLKKKNKLLEPIISNLAGQNIIFNQSSHISCTNQYRIGNGVIYDTNDDITNMFDLLIGTTCTHKKNCKKKCDTWFQLERSRLSTYINMFQHAIDYINYIISGRNIGPFGESEHTQNNLPIIIELKKKD